MHVVQFTRALATFGMVVGLFSLSLVSCDEEDPSYEEVCGPCGSWATGQISISGNAQIDGFFTAVASLQGTSVSLRSNIESELRILGNLYGIKYTSIDANFIVDLVLAVRADIDSSVAGTFRVDYQPPRCSADIGAATKAQMTCEANAGCDVQADADPSMSFVECNGLCNGSCSGACSGGISCIPPSGSAGCDLGCEGECSLDIATTCNGICHGQCSGLCSATVINAEGESECSGECSGMCEGSCEFSDTAQCSGICYGTCHASVVPPECEQEIIMCTAECIGMCQSGCAGRFTPPSASASCEASERCNAQALAQAEANFQCTPPSMAFSFELDTDLSADARAQFLARLDLLRVHLASVLQAATHAQVLVNGQISNTVVLNPPPVASLRGTLSDLIERDTDGLTELEIPAGRISCVIPALTESITTIDDVTTDLEVVSSLLPGLLVLTGDPTG
jgi:hypothetical protein